MKRRRDIARRLGAWLRAAATLALAAVMLGGAILAGRTYLWCVPMDRPMPDCCCRQVLGASPAPQDGPTVERHLFDYRTIAGLGHPVTAAADGRIAPSVDGLAPASAIAAPTLVVARVERTPTVTTAARPRSGADPPPAQRARALLQVYRC